MGGEQRAVAVSQAEGGGHDRDAPNTAGDIGMGYTVMAYVVMAYTVMACTVMAYIVMAGPRERRDGRVLMPPVHEPRPRERRIAGPLLLLLLRRRSRARGLARPRRAAVDGRARIAMPAGVGEERRVRIDL